MNHRGTEPNNEKLRLDESCILDSRFRISNLRCRIRPISIFRYLALCLCGSLFLFPVHAQESQRSTWDGVYNEEQAKRGETVFVDACSNCHGRNLEGADMTPPLTGGAFMSNWDGLTVGDLVERIRISMPLNSPGSLSRQQNTDVVAYILRFNQFPAGKNEMPRETQALKQILFKASR